MNDTITGVRASDLIAAAQARLEPLPPTLAIWISREAARALSEMPAHAPLRRAITAHDLLCTPGGRVAVSGVGSGRSATELDAIASLFESLLVAGVEDRAARADVPSSVWAILDRAHGGGYRDLRGLEAAFSRCFYGDLGGDDHRDGEQALLAFVAETEQFLARGDPGSTAVAPEPSFELAVPATDPPPPKGEFTQALEQRESPVMPQPLSSDDIDVSLRSGAVPPHPSPLEPLPLPRDIKEELKLGRSPAQSSFTSEASRRGIPFGAFWFAVGFITALFVVAIVQTWIAGDERAPEVVERASE